PVTLAAPASAPVQVEYTMDSVSTSTSTSVTTLDLPHWVRVVRTGTDFFFYNSTDGVNWSDPLRASALPASIPSSSYLAGLCVGSGASGQSCTAVFDNLTITGLQAGGSVSAGMTSVNAGAPSPAGSSTESGGTHTITGG